MRPGDDGDPMGIRGLEWGGGGTLSGVGIILEMYIMSGPLGSHLVGVRVRVRVRVGVRVKG